jgi:transcriptional regulator with XRE-family HTH domain
VSPRRSTPDTLVGEVLRAERERQNRSQESVAHDAGVTTGTLGRVERGNSDTSWSTVTRIADALGLSLEELGRRIDGQRG